MNIADPNVEMVCYIANALGELREDLVFVGGCAAGLLITDASRAAIRATDDVDVIVEISGHLQYQTLSDRLRSRGFREDKEAETTCRWLFEGIRVDVMPTDPRILGFTNHWYEQTIASASRFSLPDKQTIRLISPPLLVATKIGAFHGRGRGNYELSHDIEDIIAVVDGRPELRSEIDESTADVQGFISEEIETLLGTPAFSAAIPFHLKPDAASQERTSIVLARLREIAGL